MTKEYMFTLPIGDWSDDGHGKCEYYTARSNKTIKKVREVHFQMKNKLGYDIEELACEYGVSYIASEIMDDIIKLGFHEYIKSFCKYKYSIKDYYEKEDEDYYYVTSEGMAYLWVFLLMKTDKSLKLEILKTPESLSFYGFDDKGRHIGFVGYGCFN